MRKTIREQAALILELQHKEENGKRISLDLYAKEKQLEDRNRELALARQKIATYYDLLEEIKRHDTNWAKTIQQLFSGQNHAS